jgi:hypothetical protein
MNRLLVVVLVTMTFLMVGCASHTKKMWQDRGYSEAEVKEIEPYTKQYIDLLAQGSSQANAFNTTPKAQSESRVRSIFCTCVKKLGKKCQQRPVDLKGDDRVLWAKSNASESALKAISQAENPFQSESVIDLAECN